MNHPPNLLVKDLICPLSGLWNEALIHQMFHPATASKILSTPTSLLKSPDTFFWPHTTRGNYSISTRAKVAIEKLSSPRLQASSSRLINKDIWQLIWKCKVPQKIRLFLWKICHNSLAVRENLRRRKIAPNGQCPICLHPSETIEHMLFFCPWTKAIWFGSQLQWTISPQNFTTADSWLLDRCGYLSHNSLDFAKDFSALSCTL